MKNQPQSELLPPGFERPRWLLWLFVLPQLTLLAMQYSQWTLIVGEMNAGQKDKALTLAGFAVLLVVLHSVFGLLLAKQKSRIPLPACILSLLAYLLYLWGVFAWMDDILPSSVRLWILPESEYLFYPFALIMPALVYCGVRLAGVLLPISRNTDIAWTIGGIVGIPLVWFMILQTTIIHSARAPVAVIMVLLVGATTLMLLLFIRLLLYAYRLMRKKRIAAWILPLASGIIAPIAGLLLNRTVPFPYDFQSAYIYVLTVINGLLLVASVTLPLKAIWSLVLRAITYTFSLYFFVVFLPFLPLSLLAMIAAGLGFLILAPTFLFITHTQLLVDAASNLSARWGRVTATALTMLIICLLPAILLLSAYRDRIQLDRALTYVWEPNDLQQNANFRVKPVLRAIQRVENRKSGVYYPFLSEIYNRIVLDGMTLPERKLELLQNLLAGKIEESPTQRSRNFLFGMRNGRQRARGGQVRMPERKVQISELLIDHTETNGFMQADISLSLQNQGGPSSEYVTDIQVPEGVIITDYWLDVEGERVPGRIFERKTALWVYHMIRDVVRRDPGLLFYETPTQLKLRVFPFDTDQTRDTGWTCLFPKTQQPTIIVGDQELKLNPQAEESKTEANIVLGVRGDNGTGLVWPNGAASDWEPHTREAYAHFIVDHSLQGYTNLTELAATITNTITQSAPHMKNCTLTLANFASEDVITVPIPLELLGRTLSSLDMTSYPLQGGFDPERVIRRHLRIMEMKPEMFVDKIPMFIVLTPSKTNIVWMEESRLMDHVVADHPSYYVLDNQGLQRKVMNQEAMHPVDTISPPSPIHYIRLGNYATTLPDGNKGIWRFMPEADATPERYNPAKSEFEPLDIQWLEDNSQYTAGIQLWTDWQNIFKNPDQEKHQRIDLVDAARERRVLFPLASFIVVENEAQWRMLERKESETANARKGLEFDEFIEAPAPGILIFLPVVWWLYRRRRRSM